MGTRYDKRDAHMQKYDPLPDATSFSAGGSNIGGGLYFPQTKSSPWFPLLTSPGTRSLFIRSPPVLAFILPWQLHHPIDVLKIKPPLLLRVGLAVTHDVVAPHRDASCKA